MVDCSYSRHSETTMAASHCELHMNVNQGTWNVDVQARTPSVANTIIILDWDDTLLSSSWLASKGLSPFGGQPLPQEAVDQLKKLEAAVLKLLEKALLYGEVHLVTNAETGWVEMSAEAFLPGVVPLLPKVNIVSARSSYQTKYPDQPSMWKVEAFRNGLEQVFQGKSVHTHEEEEKTWSTPEGSPGVSGESYRNVISLGDSMHERLALKRVTSNMESTYSKSVKFVERPTIEQLERELTIISGSFDYLCTYGGNLDLMLVVEMLKG